jgi:hypothetical protein
MNLTALLAAGIADLGAAVPPANQTPLFENIALFKKLKRVD